MPFEPITSSFEPIDLNPATKAGNKQSQPQKEKKKGILSKASRFVGGMTRPFTRAASSAIAAPVATGAVVGAGIRELAGDKDAMETILPVVESELTKPRDLGILGQDVTPYGFNKKGEAKTTAGFGAEMVGALLEGASSLFGGKVGTELGEQVVKQGAKQTAKKLAGQSFDEILRNAWIYGKEGAKIGAIGGAGSGLQEDENQIINAIAGAGLGAGAGMLLAGAGSVMSPILSKLFVKPVQTAKGISGTLTKPLNRIGERLEARVEAKADINDAIESVKSIARDASSAEKSARDLISGGTDPADIRVLSNFNNKELSTVLEMFDVAESRAYDPIKNPNLPRTVLGKKANDYILKIKDVATNAGKKLGELRKGLDDVELSQESVASIEDKLLNVLTRRGIGVEEGKVFLTPDATIAKSKLPFYQTAWDILSEGGLTPARLDKLRQRLFAEYQDIISQQVKKTKDVTLKQDLDMIRGDMLDAIDEVIPGFRKQTEIYAKAEQAVNGWMKAIGLKDRNINTMKEGELRKAFDDFSANTLSRLESNASQKMMDAIAGIKVIGDELGIVLDEDLKKLATMSITLEDLFGIEKLGTLGGRVKAAGDGVAQKAFGTAKDVATGNVPGVAMRLLEPLIATNNPNQIKNLRKLLEALAKKAQ